MNPKKRISLPKMQKCVCGRVPYFVVSIQGDIHVECGFVCWRGPERPTRLRAVNAWNKLMQFNYAAGGK